MIMNIIGTHVQSQDVYGVTSVETDIQTWLYVVTETVSVSQTFPSLPYISCPLYYILAQEHEESFTPK